MGVGRFLKSFVGQKPSASLTRPEFYEIIEPNGFGIVHSKNLYYDYLFKGNSQLKESHHSLSSNSDLLENESPLSKASGHRELTVPEKLVIELVINNLRRRELRIQAVPRLPSVIPKLLRSLRDPKSSTRHYVEIINKDPVMSAAVIKLSNSAYFNPHNKPIDDIDFAVVKLGIDGLRAVLSAAVMQPIIQRESPYFSQTGQRLWMHSLNCAVACEAIGLERGMDRYKVYLMGLVHDIGKITLFSELCKQFKLNNTSGQDLDYSSFAPPMKKISAHLSYVIAKDWELPDDICTALQQQVGLTAGTQVDGYTHLLYQANLATEAYATTPYSKRNTLEGIVKPLNLPPDLWKTLDRVSAKV